MKISVTWILLSVVVLANCQGKETELLVIASYLKSLGEESRSNCIKESGVPLEIVDNFEHFLKNTADKRFKCYLKCSFLTTHLIDQNGVVNTDTLKSLIKATNSVFLDKVKNNCKQPKTDDFCESAFQTAVCILTTAEEENIFV